MSSRILPSIAFMIAIAIFFAYIRPTWNGPVAAAKAAIDKDNQALAAADHYKAREHELAAAKDAIDPTNLARLSTLLPDSVDNVGLILNINALAARSGLLLSDIDVAATTKDGSTAPMSVTGASSVPADRIGSIDLTLSASGSYTALQAFLDGIEKSARLLDVENIIVTGSDTGVYTYHMTMRLYWLR